MNLFTSAILTLAALLSTTVASYGKEKVYVIGVEEIEYYPHYDLSKKSSFTKDLMELFAEKQGFVVKFEPLPVKRLFHYFVTKRLDFKYPDHLNLAP